MSNYSRWKGIGSKLSIKKDEDHRSDHYQVYQKNEVKVTGGNINFLVLRELININAYAHERKKHQCCQRKNKSHIFFRTFALKIIIHSGKNKKTFDKKSKVLDFVDINQGLNINRVNQSVFI